MTTTPSAPTPPTPFHDLDHYLAIPRVAGLAISPDGRRLITTVATLNKKRTGYASALWELDPDGERPARRITRSAKGEAGAAFSGSGDLYFTSARPDPDNTDDAEPTPALWVVPAEGGEARLVVNRSGGIAGLHTGKDTDTVVVAADLMPGAADEKADAALRKLRKENKVQAILHAGYPVRFWDSDLGPGQPHLFAVEDSAGSGTADPDAAGNETENDNGAHLPGTIDARPPVRLRDLVPDVGSRLRFGGAQLSPDGSFLLGTLSVPRAGADVGNELVRIDVAGGGAQRLAFDPDFEYEAGPISPDGTRAVVVVQRRSTPQRAEHCSLAVLDLSTGELTALAGDWDRWGRPVAWFPDGGSVLVIADSGGRAPLFRIGVTDGSVTQLTTDDAAYSEAVLSPDGGTVFGVRSSYGYPPEVVRIDVTGNDSAPAGEPVRLPNPVERPAVPGRLEEVHSTAPDGTAVRGWLVLPEGTSTDSPAPLALWIHGGPVSSWNAWSWRWCPWLFAAQGYAVLLPDPALSTGYGQDFIQRGWGRWGAEPFTDLMAITDTVEAREDINAERTVAMGGSFGGYMANWVAGHTDRFSGIVTHASLWALDQFGPTTDMSMFWAREMTPEMSAEHSPHASVGNIVTPMLVIHGDKDYRVPIGEGLRLWYDLLAHSGLPAAEDGTTDHRFLYFPDENHWILSPQHAKLWYQVVLGFVNERVHGTAPELPATLGLTPAPDGEKDSGS